MNLSIPSDQQCRFPLAPHVLEFEPHRLLFQISICTFSHTCDENFTIRPDPSTQGRDDFPSISRCTTVFLRYHFPGHRSIRPSSAFWHFCCEYPIPARHVRPLVPIRACSIFLWTCTFCASTCSACHALSRSTIIRYHF